MSKYKKHLIQYRDKGTASMCVNYINRKQTEGDRTMSNVPVLGYSCSLVTPVTHTQNICVLTGSDSVIEEVSLNPDRTIPCATERI